MNWKDFIAILLTSLGIGLVVGILTTTFSSLGLYLEWLLTTDYSQWTVPYRIQYEQTMIGLIQYLPLGIIVGFVVCIVVFGLMVYYNEYRW